MDTNTNPFIYIYQNSLQDQWNNLYRQGNLINTMNMIRQNFQSLPQLHVMNMMTSPMAQSKIRIDQQNLNNCTKENGNLSNLVNVPNHVLLAEMLNAQIHNINQDNSLANSMAQSKQDLNAELLMKLRNQSSIYNRSIVNQNNNTQFIFPSTNTVSHVYNRDYYKNNYEHNKINNSNYNSSNESFSYKKTCDISEKPGYDFSDQIIKNQIKAVLETSPTENHENKQNKPTKKNTSCPHLNEPHYAKNMCNNCYHSKGRKKLAWKCPHNTKAHYALGICQNCYQANYNKTRKSPERDEQE